MDAGKQAARAYFRSLGLRIGFLRRRYELRQLDLAEALGVSQQTVFAMELGDRRVRVDMVPALARTFGVTSDELLGIAPLPPPLPSARLTPRMARLVSQVRQLGIRDKMFVIRLVELLSQK